MNKKGNKKGTVFQETVDREHLINVCQILHPKLTGHELCQLKHHTQYSWVCVEFSVKGYGYIHFAINNHESELWGKYLTKDTIKSALAAKTIKFSVWRICNDALFNKDEEKDKELFELARQEIELNYKLPSVDEFYDNYFRD